jgi:hypothetical protein
MVAWLCVWKGIGAVVSRPVWAVQFRLFVN